MNLTSLRDCLSGGMQSMRRISLITAFAALSLAGVASAQHTIGLKLGQNALSDLQSTNIPALQPADLAGAPGYVQANWNILGRFGNNSTNSFGTNSYSILDSAGDDSHITIHWDAGNVYAVQGASVATDQGTPDKNLMDAYDDSNGTANVPLTNSLPNGLYGQNVNNKPMVYISGLKAWLATEGASSYDVVFYTDGDNAAGRVGEYWIQIASGPTSNLVFDATSPTAGVDMTTHVFVKDFNTFTANPVYQQVPLTGNLPTAGNNGRSAASGNYAVFPGLSADSFLFRTSEFNTRSGVNAIQIIPRTSLPGPIIDPLPASQTVAGHTATFRAVAAGVVPFTYQWRKNGLNLVDGGNVSGSTNATLTITNVGAGDVASYSVVVSNPNGSTTSGAAPLSLVSVTPGSYTEKIVTNGAFAYWRFNDAGDPSTNNSPAYDYVGGFNGIYGASAQNGTLGIPGPQSPDFPGFEANNTALHTVASSTTPVNYPSTYVNWVVAPPLNLNTNTVTMCAWINPAGTLVQFAACGLVFARNGGDTSGFGYGNNNNLGYTWTNGAATFNFVSGLVPPSNQWSFVALTVSPTNAILYLYNTNGQFSATNPIPHGNAVFSGATYIGDDPSSTGTPQNRAFTGYIDEVAVFNRTLADVELYTIFKKGLNVGIIPAAVAIQPQPLALFAGRTAKFTVTGSGDKPITYQWRTNGVNLVNGGRISGATSPSLTISNVAFSDAANYDVVLRNVANVPVASTPTTLTVIASNNTCAYEALLQTLNPVYYWRLNELSGTSVYDYWSGIISSANGVTLGGAGPQPTDFLGFETTNAAPQFDGFGSYISSGVSLLSNRRQFSTIGWFNSVGPQPARTGLFGQNDTAEFGFTGSTTDATVSRDLSYYTPNGGSATFTGLGQSMINPGQWYFIAATGDGTTLNLYLFATNLILQTSTSVSTTNYGASAFPFNIGGGGVLDATGNFFTGSIDEVAVFDRPLSVGELSSLFATALGTGALAPTITVEPTAAASLYGGRPITLSINAVGSSPLTYQWRTNGVPLVDGGNISGSASNSLTITNISLANAASYDVIVRNSAGSATSTVAVINVVARSTTQGYESAVLGLNPLAYYRLNEVSTTTAYDYWGGHNGLYTNNAVQGVPGPQNPPFFGFEANNTAVQVTSNTPSSWVLAPFGSLSTNTVTMAMWIKPTGGFDVNAGLLVNRNSGVAGGFNYAGGNIGYTWNNNNANTYNFRSGFTPPLEQWSFVGMVITPTNAVIYYGNPPNALQTATNVVAHTSDVFGNNWEIGSDDNSNNNNGSRTFSGSIDEVSVFTYSLSLAQMQQLYSVGANGTPVTLTIRPSGANVVLSWPRGILLEALNVTGPWTTNAAATSPYTNSPAGAQKFYRVQVVQ